MIVTLSDYIMEQEVSAASCDDIYFEQLQAEIDVNSAIANAYVKQLLMLEYAAEYTMEADAETTSDTATETTEKKNGKLKTFFKTIWDAIKFAAGWIWQKLKDFGNWVKGKFTKDAIKEAEKIAEEGTDEEVVAVVEEIKKAASTSSSSGSVFDWFEDYNVDGLKELVNEVDTICHLLKSVLNDIISCFNDKNMASFAQRIKAATFREDLATWKGLAEKYLSAKMTHTTHSNPTRADAEKARKTLGKMCQFAKYMNETGAEKLKAAEDELHAINWATITKFEIDPKFANVPNTVYSDFNNLKNEVLGFQADMGKFIAKMTDFNRGLQNAVTKQKKALQDSRKDTSAQDEYKEKLKAKFADKKSDDKKSDDKTD